MNDAPRRHRLQAAVFRTRNGADLVLGFIPDEWLHGLDYTTLEKLPGSYVSDDSRHRGEDVVWRVKADGEWVYLPLPYQAKNRDP